MNFLRRLSDLDRQASARLAIPPEARSLRWLVLIVAHSGDSPLWLLGAITAVLWGNALWRDLGWRVLLGTLVAGAATTMLKWIFHRQRPPGKGWGFYTYFDRHAFPSGHAGRSACLVVLLVSLIPAPWVIVLLLCWMGMVGLARVMLQVHFTSDIVGGWIVGIAVGIALQIVL